MTIDKDIICETRACGFWLFNAVKGPGAVLTCDDHGPTQRMTLRFKKAGPIHNITYY